MSVLTAIEDGIGSVLIDRPAVRNALDVETLERLSAAFSSMVQEGAKAVVYGGTSGAFSAGADLTLVRRAFDAEDAGTVLAPLVDTLHGMLKAMQRLPFPLVAAVEGPAVGAGMGLALAADLRVVASSAVFLAGYMAIGASPDGGTSYHLARALGRARAAEFYLRGKPMRADEMLSLGLASQVVADGGALAAATGLAREVAGTPPLALVRMRSLLDTATAHGIEDHLDEERRLVAELWPTADFREGVGAFLERRRPVFEGR